MRHQILIFISFALLVYYGLHTLLFLLLIKFFSLREGGARFRIAILLFLLSLSFIIAFIWVQFRGHGFIRWFYYGSALWLGLLINLLIILGLGLFLFTVLKWLALRIDLRSLGVFLLALTAIYTFYGLYHATQIKTKFISIPIRNIPAQWKGKKIAQISDMHLGIINGEGLARKIASKVIEQKVDMVFITGDLLDGTGEDLHRLIEPLNRITAPIYYITGNHETYLGMEKTVAAIQNTKIKLLRDEIIDVDGIQLVGIDFPMRGERKNLEPILNKIAKGKPSILLLHEPSNSQLARQYDISLQLSGHTHNGQMLPMKIFTHLIYKGFDHGLHQIGDYYLYTTSGAGTWGPPMRIGSTAEIVIITIQ